MSVVIDGKDILHHNLYSFIVMSECLENLLNGKDDEIPKGVLSQVKNFFSVGMDQIREDKRLKPIHKGYEQREVYMTHKLLADMLKKVRKIDEKSVNSELEKLALAIETLTPDGKHIAIARESYQTLQRLFQRAYSESAKYAGTYHSPYSVGTFDDDNID